LLELDPDSEAELEAIDDDGLREKVRRVCADPSGQRQPRHNFTRKFREPKKYVKSGDRAVFEFKPSGWRGLFVIGEKDGNAKGVFFIPVKGKRFWSMSDCPWH
jgi:hypothetical protein